MPASFAFKPQDIPAATDTDPGFSGQFSVSRVDAGSQLEASMSDLSVLDPAPLQELLDMGAEASLVQELVLLYQEDVPPRLARLAASFASGDAPGILVEAHQLKGATGNLGLMRFSDLAGRIETLVRQQQLQAAEPLIQALQGVYDEGLAALTQAFPAA